MLVEKSRLTPTLEEVSKTLFAPGEQQRSDGDAPIRTARFDSCFLTTKKGD